jgi:hypothetical protein
MEGKALLESKSNNKPLRSSQTVSKAFRHSKYDDLPLTDTLSGDKSGISPKLCQCCERK